MAEATKPFVVGLEEHWSDPRVGTEGQIANPLLLDIGAGRLAAMDAAGIDMQVISHGLWRPGFNEETEIERAAVANDKASDAIRAHPSRIGGLASVPMLDAKAGADELDRAVTQLGFCGAMIFPMYSGEFIDDRRFWPVFERAAALDVPIYIHPNQPDKVVSDRYYNKYLEEFPSIAGASWGFGFETGTCAMRLIFSRVFDEIPNLKIILGHMGEFIPWGLDRIEERIDNRRGSHFPFREAFCEHFWVTTSGFFSTSALMSTVMAMGVDRVMFSVDWPMNTAEPAMEWMKTIPFSAEDKEKIYGGTAKRLLKLSV